MAMTMFDRDTANKIRNLTAEEEVLYLETIGENPYGFVPRDLFDPGEAGVVYAI